MQKHQNIKALFLLGIFSMLLLHQVVPHWHHQHQTEHHHSDVANTHHHDHHHNKPESDNSKKGLIDWFLEMHIHTNGATDVLVLERTYLKKVCVEKELVKTSITTETNVVHFENTSTSIEWYHPPDWNQKTYFLNLTLRGPPSLS